MKLRQSLFWDTNPQKIDLQKNFKYVIERVADFGNDDEVRWVFDIYDKLLMRDVIKNTRNLRPRTQKLWTLLLKN